MQQEKKRVHLIVSGRVQGVAFRYNTSQEARALDLLGWVKNLRDGEVEILAEGPTQRVDRLIEWAHHGPQMARVENVRLVEEQQWRETDKENLHQSAFPADRAPKTLRSFEIRY